MTKPSEKPALVRPNTVSFTQMSQSWVWRAAGVVLGAGVIAATLTVLVATSLPRGAGKPRSVESGPGGFRVAVPADWSVERVMPSATNPTFLRGSEPGLFGKFRRAGLWIGRWHWRSHEVSELGASIERTEGDSLVHLEVGGRPAIKWTRKKRTFDFALPVVPGGTTMLTDYRVIAGDYVYQVGFWATDPKAFRAQFDQVLRSFEPTIPEPVTISRPDVGFAISRPDVGFALTMPSGWAEIESPIRGPVMHAASAGQPARAWLYVFHWPEAPPAEARTAAETNIRAKGGTSLEPSVGELGGRTALRLDFRFPDDSGPEPAYDTEWFITDGRRGSFILAIGRRDRSDHIHEALSATWKSLP